MTKEEKKIKKQILKEDYKIQQKMKSLVKEKNETTYNSLVYMTYEVFPDLTIKCDGKNLLGYLAECYPYSATDGNFMKFFDILKSGGVDPDNTTKYNENFLQIMLENVTNVKEFKSFKNFILNQKIASKIDINSRDEFGQTFLHSYLKDLEIIVKTKSSDWTIFDNLLYLCDYVFDNGFNEVGSFEDEENTIFELANIVENESRVYYYNLQPLDSILKYHYYSKRPVRFALTLTDDIKANKIKFENVFYNYVTHYKTGDVLFDSQPELGSFDAENLEQNLLATKRYLELGFNPNLKIDGDTFIAKAIKQYHDINYIINITELAIQYGFDINESDILNAFNDSEYTESEKAIYFNFIDKKGYKKENKFTDLRAESLNMSLIEIIKNNNLQCQLSLDENIDFIKKILDIINCFNFQDNMSSDYVFIEKTILNVIEERNKNIGFNNEPVTKEELLKSLRNVVLKLTNDKFDKVLIKK